MPRSIIQNILRNPCLSSIVEKRPITRKIHEIETNQSGKRMRFILKPKQPENWTIAVEPLSPGPRIKKIETLGTLVKKVSLRGSKISLKKKNNIVEEKNMANPLVQKSMNTDNGVKKMSINYLPKKKFVVIRKIPKPRGQKIVDRDNESAEKINETDKSAIDGTQTDRVTLCKISRPNVESFFDPCTLFSGIESFSEEINDSPNDCSTIFGPIVETSFQSKEKGINELPIDRLSAKRFVKLSKISEPNLPGIVPPAITERLKKINNTNNKTAIDCTRKKKFVAIRIISGQELQKIMDSRKRESTKMIENRDTWEKLENIGDENWPELGKVVDSVFDRDKVVGIDKTAIDSSRKEKNASTTITSDSTLQNTLCSGNKSDDMTDRMINQAATNCSTKKKFARRALSSRRKLKNLGKCSIGNDDKIDETIDQVATNSLPGCTIAEKRMTTRRNVLASGSEKFVEIDKLDGASLDDSKNFQLDDNRDSPTLNSMEIKNNHKCPICKKIFAHVCQMKRHMQRHSNNRPFECLTCKKKFKYRSGLMKHTKDQHSGASPRYSCKICDFTTIHYSYIRQHYIRCHTKEYKYKCKECGKMFKIEQDYTNHLKDHEAGPQTCDVCGQNCPSKSSLYFHKRHMHTISNKPYQCTMCTKRLTNETNFKNHIERHSETYTCHNCGTIFARRSCLKKHLKVPTGKESIACRVCDETFPCLLLRRIHYKIHTGAKSSRGCSVLS